MIGMQKKKNNCKTDMLMTDSRISSDVTIDGDIKGTSTITVDGTVNGNIQSEGVVIAAEGKVTGNVSAKSFVNEGSIAGKVSAESVELKIGSINKIALNTKTLSVEPSAFLSGKIKCGGWGWSAGLLLQDLLEPEQFCGSPRPQKKSADVVSTLAQTSKDL